MITHTKRRKVVIPEGLKECPTCGRHIPVAETHETVVRVVRPRNNYGGVGPGELVEVELADVPSSLAATMSMEEHEAVEAARARPKVKPIPQLAAMVENQLQHAKAQVKGSIERGKRRIERARQQAEAEAEALTQSKSSSIDLEPPSRERQDVKDEVPDSLAQDSIEE